MSIIKLMKPLWFVKPQMTFLIYLHNHALHYPTQDLPYTISIWFFSLKLNPQYFCSKLGFRTKKKKNKVQDLATSSEGFHNKILQLLSANNNIFQIFPCQYNLQENIMFSNEILKDKIIRVNKKLYLKELRRYPIKQ